MSNNLKRSQKDIKYEDDSSYDEYNRCDSNILLNKGNKNNF